MHRIFFLSFIFVTFYGWGQEPNLYEVEVLPFCSSHYDEYNIVPYKKGAYFISNIPISSVKQVKDLQNKNISSVFFQNNLKSKVSNSLKIDLNIKYHIGSFSMNTENNCIVFTAQKSDDDLTLGLYISYKKRNNWSKPKLIFTGYDKLNLMDPFISFTGDTLFFVSNMPGGVGGTDIYMAIGNLGNWPTLKSLEKNVNTSFNERYPKFYDNTLYYSSTGLFGNGGMDIFSVKLTNLGFIDQPYHFPSPVNSEGDDFAYFPLSDNLGYFSSNRKGSDDLYRLKINFPAFECFEYQKAKRCFEFYKDEEQELDTTMYAFEWKFSDGAKYNGDVANHCFAKPGWYSIELNLLDKATDELVSNVAAYDLEIVDADQLEFDLPEKMKKGETFSIRIPKDTATENSSYYWDFGDETFAMGREVSHVYKKPGQYAVRFGQIRMINNAPEKKCTYKIITIID